MAYQSAEPSIYDLIHDLRENHKQFRARRGRPCPCCSSPDWCIHNEFICFCKRSGGVGAELDRDNRPIEAGEFGFVHRIGAASADFLAAANSRRADWKAGIRSPDDFDETDEEKDRRWRKDLARWHDGRTKLPDLAAKLGVTVKSLEVIDATWNGSCWIFPERNGRGQVTALKTRSTSGEKLMIPGSRPGITYPPNIREATEIFIVEGASDVAACLTMGVPAIGRPNNCTGSALIADLLKGWPGLPIVVGENDWREPKPIPGVRHDPACKFCQRCWPGKWGAEKVAGELRKAGLPKATVWMPPLPRKDVREWLLYNPQSKRRDVLDAFQFGIP